MSRPTLRDCLEWLFWIGVAWLMVRIMLLGLAVRKPGFEQ
jgi:hypothetical protein